MTKKRKGNILYNDNPFIKNALITTKTKTKRMLNKKGDMMITAKDTGEIITPIAGFWHAEQVDNTKFVKLYINGVKAFKELTSAGTKVFELLYLRIQEGINKDQIYLSFSMVNQNITPMSEATYTRGMRELVDKGFIAATPYIGIFWLNPDYVWNGDRLTFVKEYYKSKPIEFIDEEVETIKDFNLKFNKID
jgi:hypothetical protein